jgi:hypothetical protein
MVAIRNAGRPLSEADIASFEERIGHRLPEPYRRFLLKNNGGRPPMGVSTIDIDQLPGSPTDVGDFFGISDPPVSCDIEWNIHALENRISSHLLPIADDSGGNIFCISLSQPDFGAVVYCDFDPTWHLGGAVYYSVAPDFDNFLERIRAFENN